MPHHHHQIMNEEINDFTLTLEECASCNKCFRVLIKVLSLHSKLMHDLRHVVISDAVQFSWIIARMNHVDVIPF